MTFSNSLSVWLVIREDNDADSSMLTVASRDPAYSVAKGIRLHATWEAYVTMPVGQDAYELLL